MMRIALKVLVILFFSGFVHAKESEIINCSSDDAEYEFIILKNRSWTYAELYRNSGSDKIKLKREVVWINPQTFQGECAIQIAQEEHTERERLVLHVIPNADLGYAGFLDMRVRGHKISDNNEPLTCNVEQEIYNDICKTNED